MKTDMYYKNEEKPNFMFGLLGIIVALVTSAFMVVLLAILN